MKIIGIINGPNLNFIGKRETNVYGREYFDNFIKEVSKKASFYKKVELIYRNTNCEGEFINILHSIGFEVDGIVVNAGAYTHTSWAIADAIKAIAVPVVEVHITNIYSRECFRHQSLISSVCKGSICGFGLRSYEVAMLSFLEV